MHISITLSVEWGGLKRPALPPENLLGPQTDEPQKQPPETPIIDKLLLTNQDKNRTQLQTLERELLELLKRVKTGGYDSLTPSQLIRSDWGVKWYGGTKDNPAPADRLKTLVKWLIDEQILLIEKGRRLKITG